MPVVITVLNSYSGWALAAEGALLKDPTLASVGALIGFSGAILTKIMCDGMNRSLPSVILGGFGVAPGATVERDESLVHTEMDPAGVAGMLDDAERVLVVPGYGLAVADMYPRVPCAALGPHHRPAALALVLFCLGTWAKACTAPPE